MLGRDQQNSWKNHKEVQAQGKGKQRWEHTGLGFGLTAGKKMEERQIHSQITPRPQKPQRKVLLYGHDHSRHLFPLVSDCQIGITGNFQTTLIDSRNDDDNKTSSTQLKRGMIQTIEDLYAVMTKTQSSPQHSEFYTQ